MGDTAYELETEYLRVEDVKEAMGLDPYLRGWGYAGEEVEEFVRRIVSWVSRQRGIS